MKFLKSLWSNFKSFLYYTFISVFVGQFLYYTINYLFYGVSLSKFFYSSQILSWGSFIIAMLFVGIREEALSRYLIMDAFCRRFLKLPVWFAIAFSSVTFGALHFINYGAYWYMGFPQVIMATGLGIVLAKAYFKKGLWLAIFCHAAFNIIVTLSYIYKSSMIIIGLILFLIECVKYTNYLRNKPKKKRLK